jgi:NAD(P)H-flavin reductase
VVYVAEAQDSELEPSKVPARRKSMAEYQMTLVDRQRIAKDTTAFWFDTNDASFEFRPGQHADFAFARPRDGSAGDNSRTFSVASSPHDKSPIMIAMRMRKTGFKSALQAAAIGTRFIVSRPRGSFTLHRDVTRTAVFLAGTCSRVIYSDSGAHLLYRGPVGHGYRDDRPSQFLRCQR